MNPDRRENSPRGNQSKHPKARSLLVGLLNLSLFSSAVTAGETNLIATVAGSPVTVEKVRQTVVRSGYNVFAVESARKALDESVNSELLVAAARKAGFEQDPEIAERIKQLLVEKFVQARVDKPLQTAQPTEDELRAYYQSHNEEFSQPALARGQVLTLLVRDGKPGEAVQRAEAALTYLKSGRTFEDISAQESDDPSERVSRGVGTWFTEGKANRRYPEEVVQALFATKPGEISSPIKTTKAVYLVKLVEKRATTVRTFEESRMSITRAVHRAKRQEAYEALCQELRKQFPVTVDETQLPKAVEKSLPGGGPPAGPVDVK